jgi:hypothetical protein
MKLIKCENVRSIKRETHGYKIMYGFFSLKNSLKYLLPSLSPLIKRLKTPVGGFLDILNNNNNNNNNNNTTTQQQQQKCQSEFE